MTENTEGVSDAVIENESRSHALFANVEDRTVRGLLLPYDEESRPSISGAGPVTFSKGTVRIPRDPSVVTLNVEHDRYAPVGRAVAVEETDAGVEATFTIADTEDGDEVLAAIASGRIKSLSAEVAEFVVKGARAVSAKLTGAALAREGAFASAALFSVADGEITTELDAEIDGAQTTADAPSEVPNNREEDNMPEAIVADGVEVTPEAEAVLNKAGLFAAIVNRSNEIEKYETADSEKGLFAIAGIQHSGPSTVSIGADTQNTGYLGELWSGNAYERKYVGLFHNQSLSNYKVTGWRWTTEPVVASYAGNNAEIPSNAVDTEAVTATAQRIAGGHRIDRRYLDFNDQSVIESYFRLMTESYAKVSDATVLADAVTAAGTPVALTPVAGVNDVIAGIIQGALAVVAADATPTFAVVDSSIYSQVLYELDSDKLQYLSSAFGLTGGSFDGFKVVPGNVGANNVLVGAREALTVFELPGVPIRVEAIAPHNGAFDPALYGYLATLANKPSALVLIDTDPE